MGLSNADLNLIVERASTLMERIAGGFTPVGNNAALVQRRLTGGQLPSTGDNPRNFAQTLRTLGLQPDQENRLSTLLGRVERDRTAPLPAWANLLGEMSADVASRWEKVDGGPNWLTTDAPRRPLPYEQLLNSISAFAWQRLQANVGPSSRVRRAVQRGLLGYLQPRSSGITALVMHQMFLARKAVEGSLMEPQASATTGSAEENSQRFYRAFVGKGGREGLRNFFLIYPVAARLVAEATQFWLEAAEEFFRRLEIDRVELAKRFNAGRPLGVVVALHPGQSDPHCRGRTVIIVRFQAGTRLVYKPRAMRVDALFEQLVKHLNAAGLQFGLSAPKVLDQGEYGWAEYVSHGPCSGKRGAKRFYQRSGSLACLIHWLRGIDCYRDNLVAAGEYPVLIDLEALGHPDATPTPPEEPSAALGLDDSALRTGLLPYWQLRPTGNSLYDNTALGAPTLQTALATSLRWKNVNTDTMHVQWEQRARRHPFHRPRLGTKTLSVQGYGADVLKGYSHMAKLLDGPIGIGCMALRSLILRTTRRHIRRSTVAYAMLLRRSLSPELLAEGIDRSLALCGLLGNLSPVSNSLTTELVSLERLDVPYFQVELDSAISDPDADSRKVADHFRRQRALIQDSLNRGLILAEGRLVRLAAHRKSGASAGQPT